MFFKEKSHSFIFKAFNLYNVNLVALSWLNLKTRKGKSLYLAPLEDSFLRENIDRTDLIWNDTVSRLAWLQSRGKTKKIKSFVGILIEKIKFYYESTILSNFCFIEFYLRGLHLPFHHNLFLWWFNSKWSFEVV